MIILQVYKLKCCFTCTTTFRKKNKHETGFKVTSYVIGNSPSIPAKIYKFNIFYSFSFISIMIKTIYSILNQIYLQSVIVKKLHSRCTYMKLWWQSHGGGGGVSNVFALLALHSIPYLYVGINHMVCFTMVFHLASLDVFDIGWVPRWFLSFCMVPQMDYTIQLKAFVVLGFSIRWNCKIKNKKMIQKLKNIVDIN